jgi:hypothetical protein
MKVQLTVAMAILALFVATPDVFACTATNVIDLSDQYQDNPIYETVETVLTPQVEDEEWSHVNALPAAIGTVIREAIEYEYLANDLDPTDPIDLVTPEKIRNQGQAQNFLDEASPYMTRRENLPPGSPGHYWYDLHQNNFGGLAVGTVLEHAIFHGYEWDTGQDLLEDEPIPGWEPSTLEDHAG